MDAMKKMHMNGEIVAEKQVDLVNAGGNKNMPNPVYI
jgi:hypothetical protein